MAADGDLNAEYVRVESEFSAASVVSGASAAGSHSYTASASQGLLLMTAMSEGKSCIRKIMTELAALTGRDYGGIVEAYRTGDAEVILVAMGSMAGTIKDAVDDLRREGKKVGLSTLPVEHRIKIGRLIEALTGGTAMVESMHGAGPPQAQRIMIFREGRLGDKIRLAKKLAGIPQ
jgi:pyruvate/2-oxoacid:ferredoxin oxidoreductase alpha subunit